MAIVVDNIYTKGISGRVGDALLYKHYGHKTVVTAFPRLSNIAPSARQLVQRKKFAMAVLKTRQWLQQKASRQFLQGLKLKWNSLSAYHAGIKYHMTQPENSANTATSIEPFNHPAASSPQADSSTIATNRSAAPAKGHKPARKGPGNNL